MTKELRRIGYELLDNNVKSLIDAGIKAYPVNYEYVTANVNDQNYDYVRVVDGEHKNEIYSWINGTFQYAYPADLPTRITTVESQMANMEIQQQIINTLGQELAQLKLKIMMGGM